MEGNAAAQSARQDVYLVPAIDLADLREKLVRIYEKFGFGITEIIAEIESDKELLRFDIRRQNGYSGWMSQLSVVEEGALLGPNALVWNSYVGQSVLVNGIAEDCNLYGRTTINEHGFVKNECHLENVYVGKGVVLIGPMKASNCRITKPGVYNERNVLEIIEIEEKRMQELARIERERQIGKSA